MTQPASHSNKWAIPALIIIAAIVLVAIVLLVKPVDGSPSPKELADMMEKVGTPEVQSYRMTWSGTDSDSSEASKLHQDGAFAAPDRYYLKLTEGGVVNEFITIGDTQYVQGDRFSPNMIKAFTNSASRFLTREFVLDLLAALVEPEALMTETINGVECFHYRGELDLERQFQEMLASVNTTRPGHEEQMESMETEFERIRQSSIEYEIWISEEDLLTRQIKYSGRVTSENEGEWDNFNTTIQIYDINQPVTIKPPLDDSGKLLPGWQLAAQANYPTS